MGRGGAGPGAPQPVAAGARGAGEPEAPLARSASSRAAAHGSAPAELLMASWDEAAAQMPLLSK